MQVIRGRLNGSQVELLEDAGLPAGAHVLVLVLEGEMERAAARMKARPSQPDTPAPTSASQRPSTVGDIMTEQLVTVPARMAVTEAMHLMAQKGITSVLIEPGAVGDWGIMTMRDVLGRIVRANRSADHVAVGELASRPLVMVERDLSLQECSDLMLARKIRRVVVSGDAGPVGIVSDTDIFRAVEQHGWGEDEAASA